MSDAKQVYLFREGDAGMKKLLGGKGANLAEMTRINLPVPPGFIVTTEACNNYYSYGETLSEKLKEEIARALAELEKESGKVLGDKEKPRNGEFLPPQRQNDEWRAFRRGPQKLNNESGSCLADLGSIRVTVVTPWALTLGSLSSP